VRVQLADAQAASVRERIGKLRQRFREERAFDAVHASFHVGAGFTWPVVVYVGGGKIAQGEKLAQAVRERLAKLRPAADVVTAERIPSLQVDIDQAKAATLGVSLADIQHAMLLAANASTPSRTLHLQDGRSGKTYKVRVGTKEDDLKHIDQLGDIPVRAGKNGTSRVVPLRNLATLKVVDTPAEIEHLNGVRVFAVRMNTDDADSAALIRDVESNLKELPTPNGMWIKLAR
jgi:cobalt-zinc-cadmium resistance protein CzcA